MIEDPEGRSRLRKNVVSDLSDGFRPFVAVKHGPPWPENWTSAFGYEQQKYA